MLNFTVNGGWVLLQNCHLSMDYIIEVMDQIIETETLHEDFRLWVTTEEHSKFPISFLQMAIKFTNEPPQGIKAGLKRTFTSFTQVSLLVGETMRISFGFLFMRTSFCSCRII